MPIQQYPASSGGGSAATTPVGASSLVFSALTGTGDYTYTGTITAGVYVFSGNSQDNSRIKISGSSFAAYTNGNDAPVYFNVPSTESSVNIGQAGVLGTNAWEGVNTNLNNHHFKTITRINNNAYLVGDNAGQIQWSTDALIWTTNQVAFGSANRWINQGYDIKLTEANGTFLIAAGDSTFGQAMATSTDGVFWNEVDLSYLRNDIGNLNMSSAQGVKWAHDRFFAFYVNALTMWSTTGTRWYAMPEYQAHFRSISKAGTSGNWVATSNNPSIYYSTDLVTWTSRQPVNQVLNDIVWSTERSEFVAIGEQTRYAQSTDGITWQGGQFGGTTTMYSLAYGAGRYVTVGNSGHAYHSTDGISWSTAFINNAVNPGNQFNKIIFKNGKFITGDGSYLYQSTDGVTWGTASASPYLGYTYRVESNADTLAMVYGYSAYSKNGGASVDVVPYAPFGGYAINKIYYSANSPIRYFAALDGGIIAWSSGQATGWNTVYPSNTRGDTYWKDINKGGTGTSDFVAVGTNGWITYSGNGTSWSSNYQANAIGRVDLNACAWLNPYVFAGGEDGNIYWATAPGNGVASWEYKETLGGGNPVKTIYALTGAFIIAAGGNGKMKTSTNGITWTSRDSKFGSTTIRHVNRQDNGVYVAVGDNGTMRQSTDGITWTTRISGTTNRLLAVSPKSLSSSLGTIVVGEQSTMLVNNDSALTSYIQVPMGYARSNVPIYNSRVAVLNNNYFVTDSIGDVYVSTDLVTWTNPLFTFGTTKALSYFSGTYLVGNNKGYLYTSTNLTVWTSRDAGFYSLTDQTQTNNMNGLVSGPSAVMAFGSSSKLSTSTNGITWTTRTSPLASGSSLTAGFYYNNLFIISDSAGLIATSTDAVTWTIRKSPLNAEYFIEFTSDATKVAGITNTNNIYYSADAQTWVAGATGVQPTGASSIVDGNSMFVVAPSHTAWSSNSFATSLSGSFSDKVTYGYQFWQEIVDIDWSPSLNAFLAIGYTGMLMKQVPPVKAMPITAFLYSTNITKVN
jgi:hypothetical protein